MAKESNMPRSNLQRKPKRSEMTDEERVRDFQRKLYRKAKQDKTFRFYVLYDKICLKHVLREAYRRVKENKGAPGVDGDTFEKITKRGVSRFLERIRKELLGNTYKPQAVKRVMIPKPDGRQRPLGIPAIRDRVVQTACKMVIEPIFEADFQEGSYGFRPKRSAEGAVKKIKEHLRAGREKVYDADLSKYFDTIPHNKLLILIGKRISDKKVIHLIKMWLKAPVMEEGKITGGKKNKKGTPQGGVISPLMANIYLDIVDKTVNRMEEREEDIRIVRYADDFVLMGKEISKRVKDKLETVLERMELTVNEEKTRTLDAREETFDFLGFTFHKRWSRYKREDKYYHIQPSRKSQSKLKKKVKECLKRNLRKAHNIVIKELNTIIKGWINYFRIDGHSFMGKPMNNLNGYLRESIYRYHKRKSQRYNKRYSRIAYYVWIKKYGLVDPTKYCKEGTVNA